MATPECCRQLYGGNCAKDDMVEAASILTHNMYATCKTSNDEFPILLQFSERDGGLDKYVFLGRLIGEGKLVFFSHADLIDRAMDLMRWLSSGKYR